MDGLLRDGVDLQALSAKTLIGDSYLFEEVTTPAKIREYLDSSKDHDKVKGLKLLLAMLSKGKDVPEFLPDVVKNIMVSNIEVKKMVYIYLVHYADFNPACREISLLSINSFQKDLSGSNPLIRGLALRVMTSIRVPDIIQIQLLAARKCAADSSPYVRKCAANAIPKIYAFDRDQLDQLKQLIEKLLKDTSTMVLGSAIAAFNEICPTSYEIIHRTYRKICHLLADLDEWSQITALEVLTRYTREHFTDPTPTESATAVIKAKQRSAAASEGRKATPGSVKKRKVIKKAFYSDEEDETVEEEIITEIHKPEVGSVFTGANADTDGDLDPDHRLILKSSLPLLKSRNSGVVLGVCTLHYYCGTQNQQTLHQIGKALVRISRNQREVQYIVLHAINRMARERPHIFRPFLTDFFIKATDPLFNRLLKLEILTSLCTKDNIDVILRELQIYVKDPDAQFVSTAVKAVGRVVDVDPSRADLCMEGIMRLLLISKAPAIVSSCVVVLRLLIQQNLTSKTSAKVMKQLVKLLIADDSQTEKSDENHPNTSSTSWISDSTARSCIVWLIGEYQEPLMKVTPDILRLLAKRYVNESTETKMQILTLAIKVALQFPEDEKVQHLMTYVLEMSRYDVDTDLRDRARFMTALMGLAPTNDTETEGNNDLTVFDEASLGQLHQYARSIMSAQKLPPVTLFGSVDVAGMDHFIFGSLTSVVGHAAVGYNSLPAWADVQSDPSVRDPVKYLTQEEQGNNQNGPSFSQEGGNRRRSDSSSSSDVQPNEDDFRIFEDKSGAATNSITNSSEEERNSDDEDDSGSSGKSSGDDSSDDEGARRGKGKNKSGKSRSKSSGDDGFDLMSAFKKTASQPQKSPTNPASSGRNSSPDRKSKPNKSKSVSKSRSHQDQSSGDDERQSQSSDEDDDGDLFAALGKTSHLKKSAGAKSQAKTGAGTVAKSGIRRVPMANNVFNNTTSNLIGVTTTETNPSNYMEDLEDAFGFLSTTTKPTNPPISSAPANPVVNPSNQGKISTSMTMTNNDIDALFMPKKSQPTPVPSNINSSADHDNLLDFGSPRSTQSTSNSTSPKPTHGKMEIPSPTSLTSQPLHTNSSPKSNTSTSLLPDLGVQPLGNNALIPPNSSIPYTAVPSAFQQHDKVSNILNAFDNNGKPSATSTTTGLTSAPVTSPSSSAKSVMLPNPPPVNTLNASNGALTVNTMPLQVHPVQQLPTLPPNIPTERPAEEFTDPRAIVNPAMSGGLLVSVAFRKGVKSATYIGATSLFVIVKNMKDKQPIKRIHVGFPADVRKTNLPDLPILHPGQEVFLPMEIVLTAFTSKNLKVDIRTDQGAFVGLFQINEWDVMTPVEMTCSDFEAMRDRYKGLREVVKSYPLATLSLQYSDELELLIMNRIRQDLLMFLVQGVGIGELMFAGSIKKEMIEEKVLLTILTNEREITIKVNAEDPVFNASFLAEVKKLVMKIK